MKPTRRTLVGGLTVAGVALAIAMLIGLALSFGRGGSAHAQPAPPRSSMEARLNQVIQVLQGSDCNTAGTAIDDGMEILYGGLRVLPSKGDALTQTHDADEATSAAELGFAEALKNYSTGGGCSDERGRALDLKLFIEQMNEVAAAVGDVTSQCGGGDSLAAPPCSNLKPLIDEATGAETPAKAPITPTIQPGFSVLLRSPAVPPWFGKWEEQVSATSSLAKGECSSLFKEARGLLLRLHFERMTVVTDPWVATFGVPRGTVVPIWRLEWVPAQFVKSWTVCNLDGKKVLQTVNQQIKEDNAVNFYWRFYPKDP